jgi:hypothetical protein
MIGNNTQAIACVRVPINAASKQLTLGQAKHDNTSQLKR